MSKNIALFIHGFMGSPRQFDYLARAARAAGWGICAPALPGHGADLREFARHGKADWSAAVDGVIGELRTGCDKIVIVAHSMGGLLAINSYINNPDRIERVIALALPLRIKLTLEALSMRLASLRRAREGEDERVTAARELCSVTGVTLLNSAALLPNSIALLELISRARRQLRAHGVPLTVINSQADEMVAASAVRFVRGAQPAADIISLKRSSHFWYSADEKAVIESALVAALAAAGRKG